MVISAAQMYRAQTESVFRECVLWEENDGVEECVSTEIEARGLEGRNKLEVIV